MPAIAHMICQSCGAHSEGLASRNGSSATSCPCGGTRQVVRIARHPWGAPSASPEELERSVQERADDETLTPVPRVASVAHGGREAVRQEVEAEEGSRGWIG